jgi:hypothetical protein
MTEQRQPSMSKIRFRNLKQYKDLSDDEFDDIWEQKTTGIESIKEFENRIQKKIDEFSKDYDLDDLKINDMMSLRALAQAYITLDDLENYSYEFRKGGIDPSRVMEMEKVNNVMSGIKRDISNLQGDLKISRKLRKGDKEESLVNYLEDLKIKAKTFYQEKMTYIFCPKCKMLLFTGWFHFPEKENHVTLVCNRKLQDGSFCGEKVKITSKELMEKHGVNIDNIPDFCK